MKRTSPRPVCPQCGAPLILYTDYVACERMGCGGLVNPQWLGLPPVALLRRQFPALVSTLPSESKR